MSDERYERSADMRLLELQREALGVPRRVLKSTKYSDPDPTADAPRDEEQQFVQNGAIVVAAIEAQPRSGVIAGALVTVSLMITNEGDLAARGVRLSLPLPAGTTFRPGSFIVDSEPAGDLRAADVFAGGAELGDIEPTTRRTVLLKLLVEDGLGPIVLVPHISAAIGAVLGLRAIRLTRAATAQHDAVADRPFYEVDDEAAAPASVSASPARQPTIEVVQPSESPAAVAPPAAPAAVGPAPVIPAAVIPAAVSPAAAAAVKAKPKPRPKSKTKAKPESAPKIEVVRSAEEPAKAVAPVKPVETVKETVSAKPPAPKPVAAIAIEPPTPVEAVKPSAPAVPAPAAAVETVRSLERIGVESGGGPILTVAVDRKRLSTLSGLFSGASLGMIAHYLVLNALAVRDALPGDNEDGAIALFVTLQEQLLTRALIATRLGKPPAPDSLGATLPAFPSGLSLHKRRRMVDAPAVGQIVLVRSFQSAETAFLRRTLENETASPFLRAAQLFVGLCANDAIVADDRARRQLSVALSAYAALATAEVSRIFLRAKLSRNPEIFKATDPSFDDAARTVLAALGRSIG